MKKNHMTASKENAREMLALAERLAKDEKVEIYLLQNLHSFMQAVVGRLPTEAAIARNLERSRKVKS